MRSSQQAMIKLKRAYEKPEKTDGVRILVERLWPRGLTKEKAKIDVWMKEIAPSAELRTWYGHDRDKWLEFQRRYRAELKQRKDLLAELKSHVKRGPVTFVFAAKDEAHSSATVLKGFVEKGR